MGLKSFFQPAYTAVLFVIYLTTCSWLLDQQMLDPKLLVLVWLGVFSAQTIDSLGLWSPEDWINQPERISGLYRFRQIIYPIAIFLCVFSSGLLLIMVPHKVLYLQLAIGAGLAFLFYVRPFYRDIRLKKIKYLKSFVVAAAWILLAIAIDFGFNRDHFFIKTRGVVFVLCSCVLLVSDTLLLDMRDRVGDRQYGIWSFPKSWDKSMPIIIFGLNIGVLVFVSLYGLATSNAITVWLTMSIAHLALAVSALAAPVISNQMIYLIAISSWIPVSAFFLYSTI